MSTSHTHIPVKPRSGEGKEMVPETPPSENMLDWDSDQIVSALPQINTSQLSSFVLGSGVPLMLGVGRAGALGGDVWILSWGRWGV